MEVLDLINIEENRFSHGLVRNEKHWFKISAMKNSKRQDRNPKAASTSLSGIESLSSAKNHFSRIDPIRSIFSIGNILNSHCFYLFFDIVISSAEIFL